MHKKEEIEKLKKVLIEKIKKENDDRYKNLPADELMEIITDSSLKGKYVFWVLREYLKENIQRFEDMSRVKQALTLFKNNLSKFSEQQKQLNKMSFQELEMLVEPYHDALTQNTVKRMNKEKIWSEIETIYSGPEGKILIPKTKEASILLGQGTKWCTAAVDGYNPFNYYNDQGPLYVFILSQKDFFGREIKYQMHFESNQFMNSEDSSIQWKRDNKILSSIFNKLPDYLKIELLMKNNDLTEIVGLPDDIMDSFYLQNMKYRPFDVLKIKNLTDEIILKAIEINPEIIFKTKKPTHEMCLKAVQKNGLLLKYINKPSTEICLAAIEENSNSIQYIDNLTDELKFKIIKEDVYGDAIQHIKNPTEKMCLEALKANGRSIEYIKNPTEEMIKIAIKTYGPAIRFLENPTEDQKLEAVKYSGRSIEYIKNPSDLVKLEACKQDGRVINLIENPTYEMELFAIRQNGWLFQSVKNKTEEICLEAVKKNGLLIQYIENPTYEMKIEAVKQNGFSIRDIPDADNLIKLEAVKQNGLVIQHIENPTYEMKMEAVKQNGFAIESINELSDEIEITAIKQNINVINCIYKPTEEIMMLYFNHYNESISMKDMITYVKPTNINNIKHIIDKTQNNPLINTYFKSYLEDILKKTPKNDEEITMKI